MAHRPSLRNTALRLQDGGVVPGSGRGDKIPAKYEPGEFVVSNDMIDDNPGLREHLAGLRAETLAARGKTVEEADAKALRGGRRPSLRAVEGFDPLSRMAKDLTGQNPLPPRSPMGSMADDLARNAATVPDVPPRPAGPGNPNVPPGGSAEANAFRQARGAAPTVEPAAPAATSTAKPTLRAGLAAESGAVGKGAYAGGRLAGAVAKMAGPASIGFDVVSHFNDYKIDDPGVDSSAAGTWNALKQGDFSGAGRSLSKGAVEAGMDLGSFAANTLDYVVPGKAPVSTAYDRMLRNQFGSQLIGATGRPAAEGTPVDTAASTQASPTPRNPYADANAAKIAASDAQNKTAGQPQPQAGGYGPIGDRTTLTNEQAAVMNPAGRVTMKRGANGIMELSGGNVSGQVSYNDADGKALAGGGLRGKGFSNFDVAPAGANVVTGPNGYAFATSGSGLRGQGGGGGPQMLGGVDVSGLSGAQAMQYADEVRNAQRINDSQQRIREASAGGGSGGAGLRSPEYLAARNASVTSTISRDGRPRLRSEVEAETARARMALDAQNAQMQNQTMRRGQDISADASRYGYDNSLRGTMYSSDATLGAKHMEMQQRLQQQQLKGAIFREAGGKPEVAAKIAAMYGMDAKDFTDMAAAEQTRAQGAATSARKRLEGMAVVRNEKGEDVVSEGRVANLERTLTKMAPGWQHMSEPEQAELYGKAEASVNLLEGLNDRRNNSFWQSVGVDGKSASLDNLPDMKGGRLTTVKLLEGAMTGGGVSRGDYALEVGGHKLYLPRDKVNQGELELLKARGVDISGMQK